VEPLIQGVVGQNRRSSVDRRATVSRDRSPALVGHVVDDRGGERRVGERRRGESRADDVPSLVCPDCLGPLQYEAGLSWNLPGSYTVDSGYCQQCARRFLRNRETGDYDALSW